MLISLPVAAHLKKYLEAKFGSPVVLDNSHHILIALKSFLTTTSQTVNLFDGQAEPAKARELPNSIQLMVLHNTYKAHIKLHWRRQALIHKYIEKVFVDDLQDFVDFHKGTDLEHCRRRLIYAFLDKHKIMLEHDITTDCILKLDFRYRETRQKVSRQTVAAA